MSDGEGQVESVVLRQHTLPLGATGRKKAQLNHKSDTLLFEGSFTETGEHLKYIRRHLATAQQPGNHPQRS